MRIHQSLDKRIAGRGRYNFEGLGEAQFFRNPPAFNMALPTFRADPEARPVRSAIPKSVGGAKRV